MRNYTPAQKKKVRETLSAVLASPGFANASQMSSFLEFVVERTLEGDRDAIKGYTIGVDALGRGEDFDPQTDPTVRVMAGRLRQALENYNRDVGPVPRIEIPKGSYVPSFHFADGPAAAMADTPAPKSANSPGNPAAHAPIARATDRPSGVGVLIPYAAAFFLVAVTGVLAAIYWVEPVRTVAIVPPLPEQVTLEQSQLPNIRIDIELDDAQMPEWTSAAESAAVVINAVTRFSEFRFFVDGVDETLPLEETDYVFAIRGFRRGSSSDLIVYLIVTRPSNGEVIWTERLIFSGDGNQPSRRDQQLVADTASALLSPYGILYGDVVNNPEKSPRLLCINRIWSYFSVESMQSYATGKNCAERAIATGNASSSMHAMLSFLYVEAYRKRIGVAGPDPLKRARELAAKSILLEPENARAHQAQFAIDKITGKYENALATVRTAITLNPNDRDLLGDFAAYLIANGQPREATPSLKRAIALTPTPPAWLQFYDYLHSEMTEDTERADELAARFNPDTSPLIAVAMLLAADRQGRIGQAAHAAESLARQEPEFAADPRAALIRRGFLPELADRIAGRLIDAGVTASLLPDNSSGAN